jgi:hypothetical protein
MVGPERRDTGVNSRPPKRRNTRSLLSARTCNFLRLEKASEGWWNGARGGGRTHNLQLRRLTLYPIELHAQGKTTIRTRVPLLKWNLQIAAAHCERCRLPGGHRSPLQNTHCLCAQKQKGTARGRPDINYVTPQIIVSAVQRVHLCSRLFRCPEAANWDGVCVVPWETFFATYQIAPA